MPAGVRKRKSRTETPTRSPSGNGAGAHTPAAVAPEVSPWRSAVGTWPRKVAATLVGALLASGVSYFFGADFWQGVEKKVGTAGAPLQITTVTDVDQFNSDVVHIPEFVVTRPISEVPRPPSGNSFEGRFKWAKAMGGVDATESLFRVVIAGKEESPITLQGLRVKVEDRRPALKGTLLTYSGLGAPQSVRYIQIDLSKNPPKWDYIGPKGAPEEHFPLRVTASETEVLDVQAFGLRGDVTWYLEIPYTTADGEQKTARIDDGGQPFRTTEGRAPGQGAYWWNEGDWEALPEF